MSEHLPEEYQYLVFFAVLSGRSFTKSELGVKMTNPKILEHNNQQHLLVTTPRNKSKTAPIDIMAAPGAFRWIENHMRIEPDPKKPRKSRTTGKEQESKSSSRNKAVAVLDLLLARTDGFLKENRISIERFLKPTDTGTASEVAIPIPPEPALPVDAGAIEVVRDAYLAISGGAYDARVLLKDLRKRLDITREAQDTAFMEMIRSGEAVFYPEDDPMSRDEEDDRAALALADRRRHVMYLHREPRP